MATGAELVARTLVDGDRPVFTVCGDHTNPLLDAIDHAGIRIVDARDERGAAWMAAGWALGAGRPGVVIVSNTPALANALIALGDANASGHPVLCITGGVAMSDRGGGHPGDVDQAAFAAPWVKHAARAAHANDARFEVARALLASTAGNRMKRRGAPGVAVVELPLDAQTGTADDPRELFMTLEALHPHPDRIAAARDALARAERPVVIAGSGSRWSGAGDALTTFVERTRIPVFTTRAARGLISDEHELCFGFPNLLGAPAQAVFGEADVALVIGTKLDITLAGGAFNPGCTLIRADSDPEAMRRGRAPDIEICGDAFLVLEALADGAAACSTDAWLTRLREATAARAAHLDERARIDTSPIHPGRLVAEVARALAPDAIVTVDAGELALWAIDRIPARAPASFHASSFSAMGALGMGVPWAIGLKLAQPDRPVVALVGDGSFGFSALEIETAVRHGVPITVVVGNDGGWGIVRHLQQDLHGRAIASDLPRAPYEHLAAFAGARAHVVDRPSELHAVLTTAIGSGDTHLINAIIDADVRHDALALIAAMFEAKR